MNESHSEEVIDQLEEMREAAGALIAPCKYKSSFELYGDLRARAKREQHLYFYALGTFYQMDQAQYLLDFQTMRERAIELISLLESEEQSRRIQPDVPLPIFEHLVHSMSACAYENLAEATGQLEGYNSEGLQACISDGIQICRQTGKLPCIGCFREYSCDVYMAADDSEIARHQCSLVLDQKLPASDRGNRRWRAKKKIAWMTCLEGNLDEAIELMRESLQMVDEEGVILRLESQLCALLDLDTTLLLAGKPAELHQHPAAKDHPPTGECVMFDLQGDLNKALAATMNQDWETGTEILSSWDRRLQQSSANHLWFETRLRLVALKKLQGEDKQAERLATQLESKANDASDWLTLRRLTAIMDPDLPTSPVGVFGRPKSSTPTTQPAQPTDQDELQGDAKPEDEERGGPLRDRIEEIGQKMAEIEPENVLAGMASIREEIMGIPVEEVSHHDDAGALIHMVTFMVGDCHDADQIWEWANRIGSKHQDEPTVISVLAHLGNRLRFGDNPLVAEKITAERLEPLFRKSMQMDNTRPRSFMRAGDHYMAEGNVGEAERCYARAFRLGRREGEIAMRLAGLYRDTDRPQDALHVLDVCLREGTDHPAVAWEAALSAFAIDQHEAMLTYLDRCEQESGERPWLNYYRAIGLLDQGKAAESVEAIKKEEAMIEESAFHTTAIRACAEAKVGDRGAAIEALQVILETPLYSVDAINMKGISDSLTRCRSAAADMQQSPIVEALDKLMLLSGLAPEEMFESSRQQDEKEVTLFRCLVQQPLDDAWPTSAGCLLGQETWDHYLAEWGVLAADEEEAEAIAIQWQAKCYGLQPETAQTLASDQTFLDSPGVVWQGIRFCPSEQFGDDLPE